VGQVVVTQDTAAPIAPLLPHIKSNVRVGVTESPWQTLPRNHRVKVRNCWLGMPSN